MSWDVTQYKRFLAERTQPSADLAYRVAHAGIKPQSILDIGCGPGNSTEQIGSHFPDAHTLGIDTSDEMLEAAQREHGQFAYQHFDASQDLRGLEKRFDLVFSNACIQWIPDHAKLLANIHSVLNAGGAVAIQVPLTKNMPIQRVIRETVSTTPWCNRLPQNRTFHTLEPFEYHDVLAELFDDFSLWTTTYHHRLGSYDDLVEWYRGSGLRPYLDQLNASEGEAFVSDVRQGLMKAYAPRPNGDIILDFPRLFFIASKQE